MDKIIIMMLFVSNCLVAQINTEKFKFEKMDPGFNTALGLSVDWNDGNTRSMEYSTELGLRYATELFRNHLYGYLVYKEGLGTVFKSEGLIYYSTEILLNNEINPDFFIQKNFHQRLNLKDRYLAGTHAKIYLSDLKSEKDKKSIFILNLGIGVMYEYESIKDDIDYTTEILRSTNYLNIFWQLHSKVALYSTTYYQVDISNIEDHRILSDLNFSFEITENFSLSTVMHYRFDALPPKNLLHYDMNIKQGFVFKL